MTYDELLQSLERAALMDTWGESQLAAVDALIIFIDDEQIETAFDYVAFVHV